MTKSTMTVELDEVTQKRLGAVAKRSRQSVQEVLERVIEEGLAADEEWMREIQRRLDVPRDERRYVSNDDVGRWVRSRGTDNPLPRPKGQPLV